MACFRVIIGTPPHSNGSKTHRVIIGTPPHSNGSKTHKHQVSNVKYQPQVSNIAGKLSTAIRYGEPAPSS